MTDEKMEDEYQETISQLENFLTCSTNETDKEYYRDMIELARAQHKKIKTLSNVIKDYREGGAQSIFRVSRKEKKSFTIGRKREFTRFSSNSNFIMWCIYKATGHSFEKMCEMGEG